jgi:hypothetical protein
VLLRVVDVEGVDGPSEAAAASVESLQRRVRTAARRTAVVIGGVAALVILVSVVGPKMGLDGVATADHGAVAVVIGAGLAVLFLRGVALWWLLRSLEPGVSTWRTLAAYPVTTLVSTVMPGGRAGGAPLNGAVLARTTDVGYEDGVAASLALSLLANLAVVGVGGVGVVALVAGSAVGEVAGAVARAGGVVILAAVLGVALVRHGRGRLREWLTTAVVVAGRGLRVVPGCSPPNRPSVERRMAGLTAALRQFRAHPHVLLVVGGLLVCAHALTVLALWFALAAFGVAVPIALLMTVVPVAVLAAVFPTPGGLGGVEASLATLISAGSTATTSASAVSVVLYRTGTVLPAVLCGGVALLLMFSLDGLRRTGPTG